jgi:hypothetical protein
MVVAGATVTDVVVVGGATVVDVVEAVLTDFLDDEPHAASMTAPTTTVATTLARMPAI